MRQLRPIISCRKKKETIMGVLNRNLLALGNKRVNASADIEVCFTNNEKLFIFIGAKFMDNNYLTISRSSGIRI